MKTTDACSLLDHRLETLLVLVEAGSFSAAARELYISQPAVSQQIKSLENDLDLALVKRCGKRVELTRAAYKLADYLSAFSLDSNKVMHRLRGEVEPPLKLGSTRSCGQFVLPQLMANLLEGGVRFIVKIANTEELMADIKSGDVDLALVEGNFDRASFGSFDIETVPFVGVLGKGIPEPSEFEELLSLPLLLREPGSGTRLIFEEWLASRNLSVGDFERVVEIDNPSTIANLLKLGQGVSFMYKPVIGDELERGTVALVPERLFAVEHPISCVYLKGSSDEAYFKSCFSIDSVSQ